MIPYNTNPTSGQHTILTWPHPKSISLLTQKEFIVMLRVKSI